MSRDKVSRRIAEFCEPVADQALPTAVRCKVCPRMCVIRPGKAGWCRAKVNIEGQLYQAVWGKCAGVALDPIEKKPLFHFYPGSYVVSLGTRGCNLGCRFCQNWEMSQGEPELVDISPAELAELAASRGKRCVGIAYTYSEPLVWLEFVLDAAREAKRLGLVNVLVTNGEVNPEPLEALLELVDALNVDVKAMREEFYRDYCAGSLAPVLRTVETARARGRHVEVTNLIIPTLNDSDDEIRDLVDWLAGVGDDVPLHFSRYFPHYKMSLPPTPVATLARAREIASAKLKYVYIGNVPGHDGEDTRCHNCGNVVIGRRGFSLTRVDLSDHACAACGASIPITGEVVRS